MIAALIPALIPLIDKLIPDPNQATEAKLRAIEIARKGEDLQLEADVRLALAQMDVNKVEASTDMFRGGWRPATGWVCVGGLGYQFLVQLSCLGLQISSVLRWVRCPGSIVKP